MKTLQQWCQAPYVMWLTFMLIKVERMVTLRWWWAPEGQSCRVRGAHHVLFDWWSCCPMGADQTGFCKSICKIWSWSLCEGNKKVYCHHQSYIRLYFPLIKTIYPVSPKAICMRWKGATWRHPDEIFIWWHNFHNICILASEHKHIYVFK